MTMHREIRGLFIERLEARSAPAVLALPPMAQAPLHAAPQSAVAEGGVTSIQVEDLTIDCRETTTGVDWDFRVYNPGDAHYGTVTVKRETTTGVDWDFRTDAPAGGTPDLTIDDRETTTGVDWDFRTYAPGDAHYGK